VKPPAIVFLSHSIFVEGVVNRLGQHHPYLEVHFIDPFQESYIDRILGIKPTMAVIDSEQGKGDKSCVLCNLLEAFPEITILRLKAQERDVQVISSSSYVVDNVQGLIDLLSDCL
jgi:hypothetical protein